MSVQQPEWTIRPAEPEDAEVLARVHAKSFTAAYLNGDIDRDARVTAEAIAMQTPERIEKRTKLIVEALEEADKTVYFVAVDVTTSPAGFLYGYKTETPQNLQELYALYVDPLHFGDGAAQALVDKFIAWTDPSQPIELGVEEGNIRAKRFYEKMGFKATGDLHEQAFDYLVDETMIREGDKT